MKNALPFRRSICMILISVLLLMFAMPANAAVIKGKTGIGMAEWALRAYNEGWEYVYGGSVEGTIDCSGLIRSYCNGRGGGAKALLNGASESGNIEDIPRVHGLGLWCEGHAGVYVGKSEDGTDMVVDARNSRVDVVYSELFSRYWSPWVKWFKIGMVSYPDTGWYDYNGATYYYHNGEFVVGIFTVDGVTYDFGKSGALKGESAETTTKTTTASTTVTTKTTTSTTKSTTVTTKTTTSTTKSTTVTTKTTTSTAKSTTTTAKTSASTTKTTTTTTQSTQKYSALRYGDRSDAVLELQRRLIELGYLGANASGYFGTQTEAAVRLFQKAAGLDIDGIAGPATQEALYGENAPQYGTTTTTTTTAASSATTATSKSEAVESDTTQVTSTTVVTEPTEVSETDAIKPTQPAWEEEYMLLEVGSEGESVVALQEMLKSIGYYEQPLTSYYGSFTRDAVIQFQLSAGVDATGTADAYTQYLLFNGLTAGESQSSTGYGEEYYEFGGDLYDSLGIEASGTVLAPSAGLSAYSINASPEYYIAKYGNVGGFATLGAYSLSKPVTVIYKNGEIFELTSDTIEELEKSIFN